MLFNPFFAFGFTMLLLLLLAIYIHLLCGINLTGVKFYITSKFYILCLSFLYFDPFQPNPLPVKNIPEFGFYYHIADMISAVIAKIIECGTRSQAVKTSVA